MRPGILALAGAIGIALVEVVPAAPWLGGALAIAAWAVGRRRAAALALVASAGAVLARREADRRATEQAAIASQVGVDGQLSGEVRGPVEREPGALRFVVDATPGARVLVSLRHEGAAPAILPGDRLTVRGRLRWPLGYRVPGAADAEQRAATRGVVALLAADAADADWVDGGGDRLWRVAGRLQRRLADRISGEVGKGGAALRALVTGDRGAMGDEESSRWRDSGASHVLAVSGMHLAVVALLAFRLVRRLWAAVPALALRFEPARAGALVGALLAVGYTATTGASPSAVRAMWIVLFSCLGVALDRRARLFDALGVAAILVLAAHPAALRDPSVQLSFAAAVALGLAVRRRPGVLDSGCEANERAPAGVLGALRSMVSASLWTWVATAPIAAWHFGAIALAGPVANLVAVPAVELCALPAGLVGVVLAEIWPAGGRALLVLAGAVTGRVSSALAHVVSWMPPVAMPRPTAVELAAWAVLAGALLALGSRVTRGRAILAVAAAGLSLGSWLWLGEIVPARRTGLVAAFLDVGQGDSAVVEPPGGGAWLIDAGGVPFGEQGGAPGREAVVRYLARRRIRRLDLVILSHAHPDHYRGLDEVARAVAIDEIWLARPHRPLPAELAAVLARLEARGTRIVHPPLGRVWRQGGAAIAVLAPEPISPGPAAADPVRSENDNSLVVRIEFAGRRLLFTGDVEEDGEAELEARRRDLPADLIKVPHHGSRTSSGAALVAAVSPRWAVISCGLGNRFGFPDAQVVARWRAAGAEVLRTDQAGTITAAIQPDGRMQVGAASAAE